MKLPFWCFFPILALLSASLDSQDRKLMQRNSPRTVDRMDRGEPLTLNDVIKLSQSGIAEEHIIDYMQSTKSAYHLSQTQIRRLQDAKVSSKVINFMIQSENP